ncbi:MAG: hypothetical protein K0R29_1351 [Pseudobdellovibrio sp.]|jgi:hypothetical protein|nr:hypothetical protein [Pseudobdellovibrio sp.]
MFKISLVILTLLGQFVMADLQPRPPYPQPPGGQPPPPNYPPPNNPPPAYPPSHPDYGPGYTSYWQDLGTIKAQKVVIEEVNIDVRHYYVNEIAFRVSNAPFAVHEAWAYLSTGGVINLRHLTGTWSPGMGMSVRLDSYYSLRLARIVLRVNSPQIIGPSAKAQIHLGIAR